MTMGDAYGRSWTCEREPENAKCWPLRGLADGRRPEITSRFRSSTRSDHDGVDLMYRYTPRDPWVKPGDGGSVVRDGVRRWWIPPGTIAYACMDGEVTRASGITSGHRVWVRHESEGIHTQYYHLAGLFVAPGDVVRMGDPLGTVGDNPNAFDATHLHFQVYADLNPSRYRRAFLEDPADFLISAMVLRHDE